jgi:putative N6-adenine-specific DNA methylase
MFSLDTDSTILITAPKHAGVYLQEEITELGYQAENVHNSGLTIEGSLLDCIKLNFQLRIANAVLYLLKEFPCSNPEELYTEINNFPWETLIPNNEYICVIAKTSTPAIRNSMFANQKVKDAIVDRIVTHTGKRPDSGPKRDNIVLNLFWKKNTCWLYLNTSGVKLSDRGYRKMPYKAPLSEVLAAAILRAAKYDGTTSIIAPMCGSGTLAIEAALIASKRAPGLLRNNFSFLHLKDFNKEIYYKLRSEFKNQKLKKLPQTITASDNDIKAIEAAKQNAKTAGCDNLITFSTCDISETEIPNENSLIVFNPPYGKRVGNNEELKILYKKAGDWMKQKGVGCAAGIFTGNRELAGSIGLKPKQKIVFDNGGIDCRLLMFELYSGTRRKDKEK